MTQPSAKHPAPPDAITRLAADLLTYKQSYYQGKPLVSDAAYDQLEEQLRTLAPDHPALSAVGTSPTGKGNKVPHSTPMLSLQKVYDPSQLTKWLQDHDAVGTVKIDGNSLSLVYENGRLVLAKTRGDGRLGEDVTDKITWVGNIPKILPLPLSGEVRGELFCRNSRFASLRDAMVERGLEEPTNPRNIVAGVLGRKTHIDMAAFFEFNAFDLLLSSESGADNVSLERHKLEQLKNLGFAMPYSAIITDEASCTRFLAEVKEQMTKGDIALDGAVFSYDDIAYQNQLGDTSHHPRYKMSFKWQGETKIAKIERIHWDTSRLGIVTPVAIIEPTELSGATITRVTLHNAEHIRQHNLKSGDVIEIVRSGEVIPKFLAVVTAKPGSAEWIDHCPSCDAKLEFDGVRLKCNNSANCPAQQSKEILNWIVATGIDDLSEKRLGSLLSSGLVSNIADLYRLTHADLLTLPLTKDKMATKIITNIDGARTLPLAVFCNGLGISGMGQSSWEKLSHHFSSLTAIRDATVDQIIEVDGFAQKTAEDIVDGLAAKSALIDELLEVGLTIAAEQDAADDEEQVFAEMKFVITGKLSEPRAAIEKKIKALGGKIQSSVSSATSVIVCNDKESSSSKAKKARQLEIPFWSEEELNSRCEGA